MAFGVLAGEPALDRLFSRFSCPKNLDVERFLKKSAIDFTKKNQSVTYVVISVKDGVLLGYFTLALKPLTVRGKTVSNTTKKKLLRVSELDTKSDTYTMAVSPKLYYHAKDDTRRQNPYTNTETVCEFLCLYMGPRLYKQFL